jgi:hypothetical protein
MDRADLLHHLGQQLVRPQKSERWAMYRLIVPVVDFANRTMGLRDYFEFNQTSRHGTSQSVDIVLLDPAGKPVVMVEAKRVDRSISAEQIDKYLEAGVRGIVSNGLHWVLCRDGRNRLVSICRESRAVDPGAFDEIVSFVRGEAVPGSGWGSAEVEYTPSFLKPERIAKEVRAQRRASPMTVVSDLQQFRLEVDALQEASDLDLVFLTEISKAMDVAGKGFPGHLRCEVRQTRVSFFDRRRTSRSDRVARIELGKAQPDVLVLTELAQCDPALETLAMPVAHDKGPHMRRFRLSDTLQTQRFAGVLAALLMR